MSMLILKFQDVENDNKNKMWRSQKHFHQILKTISEREAALNSKPNIITHEGNKKDGLSLTPPGAEPRMGNKDTDKDLPN